MVKMKPYKNATYDITVYNEIDIKEKEQIIFQAITLWQSLCIKYVEKFGDRGTCVLGAGIAIYFLPPRCRNYQTRKIIPVSIITRCQGASVWEHSVEQILSFLKSNDIEAFYECGSMD